MSVYKEGFYFFEKIRLASQQIFSDAIDFGAPVNPKDELWNYAHQLVEDYLYSKREATKDGGAKCIVKLVDEGTAVEHYIEVKYTPLAPWKNHPSLTSWAKGFKGFVSLTTIENFKK